MLLSELLFPEPPCGASPLGFSDGAFPSGASPDGAFPSGASPDGAFPSGASPDGAFPSGASPDGASPICGPFPPPGPPIILSSWVFVEFSTPPPAVISNAPSSICTIFDASIPSPVLSIVNSPPAMYT